MIPVFSVNDNRIDISNMCVKIGQKGKPIRVTESEFCEYME